MMQPQYILFLVLTGISLYILFLEELGPVFISLWASLVEIKFRRFFFWLRYHPESPILRIVTYRNAEKSTKLLRKEFGLLETDD